MPLPIYSEEKEVSARAIRHTLAIAAGKGGVGKSTATVCLALALKKRGYAVGILDADLYGPSTRIMLPEENLPRQEGSLIYPAIAKGIPIISMSYFKEEGAAAAIRAPVANNTLLQLLQKCIFPPLDLLLIDFPPGTGDIQMTLCQQGGLTAALLITTPQRVSAADVARARDLFAQCKVPLLGIVENLSSYTDPHLEPWALTEFGEP